MNDAKTPREPRPPFKNREDHAPRRDAPGRDGSRPDRVRSGHAERHAGGAGSETASPRFRRDERRPATRPESNGVARAPRRSDSLGPLRDIDEDILKLIVRRARLLARMPENATRERALRTHWEEHAARVSRDPRLIRQLFTLLQEVNVAAEDLTTGAFNLAPSSSAVQADLAMPGSSRQARLYATLAAAAGAETTLNGVLLNTPLVECVKMLGQLGANARWDDMGTPRVRIAAGKGFAGPEQGGAVRSVLDKVLHAGEDPLNLYLLLFMMLTRPTRVKILGESTLRFLDLSPVRHFLPRLGARLSNVVPGQDGLPVRLEASALLPCTVNVPGELPDDAVTALLLATPFWHKPVTVDLGACAHAETLLDEADAILRDCGCETVRQGFTLRVTPGVPQMPAAPALAMTLPLAFTLLAMPGLAGGHVVLHGQWPAKERLAAPAEALLRHVVDLRVNADTVESSPRQGSPEAWDFTDLPAELIGPALALFVNQLPASGKNQLPALPDGVDTLLADEFLRHLGYGRNGHALTPLQEGERLPWAAPDVWWGIGFALAAFTRRDLRLSNPNSLTALIPPFWTAYNSLPEPTLERQLSVASDDAPSGPVRRRIHSKEFLAEEDLPPALDYDND